MKGYADRTATEELARRLEHTAKRARAGLDAWVADLEWRGKSPDCRYYMRMLMNKMADGCVRRTLGSIRSDSLTAWLSAGDFS